MCYTCNSLLLPEIEQLIGDGSGLGLGSIYHWHVYKIDNFDRRRQVDLSTDVNL